VLKGKSILHVTFCGVRASLSYTKPSKLEVV
jgi:hypothetical protein